MPGETTGRHDPRSTFPSTTTGGATKSSDEALADGAPLTKRQKLTEKASLQRVCGLQRMCGLRYRTMIIRHGLERTSTFIRHKWTTYPVGGLLGLESSLLSLSREEGRRESERERGGERGGEMGCAKEEGVECHGVEHPGIRKGRRLRPMSIASRSRGLASTPGLQTL